MKKETQLLKDLAIYLMNTNQHIFRLENDLLDIDCVATVAIEDKKIVSLSFEVTTLPTHAAIITKSVLEFCLNSYKDYKVEIFETYAFVMNDEGVIEEVLFGDEALEHFYNQQIRFEKPEENETIKQEAIDSILDQISKKGKSSLTKDQKKLLNDFSKGKKND